MQRIARRVFLKAAAATGVTAGGKQQNSNRKGSLADCHVFLSKSCELTYPLPQAAYGEEP